MAEADSGSFMTRGPDPYGSSMATPVTPGLAKPAGLVKLGHPGFRSDTFPDDLRPSARPRCRVVGAAVVMLDPMAR